jgi:hypothetical protein
MIRLSVILAIVFGVITLAYTNANKKLTQKINLESLRLQMTVQELEKSFGSPFSRQRNALTYILEDASQLHITLRDDLVASAIVKFHNPIRIEDPQIRQLTLVQMSPADLQNEDPSWFFAGKPEEGLIYKISQNGVIESITWVPPFSYGRNQAKNLQALLKDFRVQHLSNL